MGRTLIVGAGVSGLQCGRILSRAGHAVEIYETADSIGGRVRTDRVEGFLLDHGFQVLQVGYPEAAQSLELEQLDLQCFESGALVQTEAGRQPMFDPWRRPAYAFRTVFNAVGTLADRWRLGRLRANARKALHQTASGSQDCSISQLLQRYRFSDDFVERFLRPWISGMFFDEELESSADFFRFVFAALATGPAALPSTGIGAIPQQLAAGIPDRSIHCRQTVSRVESGRVQFVGGQWVEAEHIVLAVPAHRLASLVSGIAVPESKFLGTLTFYFAAADAPAIGKALLLNGCLGGQGEGVTPETTGGPVGGTGGPVGGTGGPVGGTGGPVGGQPVDPLVSGQGPISNLVVLSQVAPTYAPEGQALIGVTVRPSVCRQLAELASGGSEAEGGPVVGGGFELDSEQLSFIERQVRQQATGWFGSMVGQWRTLKHYWIPRAVPRLLPGRWEAPRADRLLPGVWACGDSHASPSLHGALASGRAAAQAILAAKVGGRRGAGLTSLDESRGQA